MIYEFYNLYIVHIYYNHKLNNKFKLSEIILKLIYEF
jgi:hypothetical protein